MAGLPASGAGFVVAIVPMTAFRIFPSEATGQPCERGQRRQDCGAPVGRDLDDGPKRRRMMAGAPGLAGRDARQVVHFVLR
jgi:hypothetical protein